MNSPDRMRPFLMKVGRGKKLSRPLSEEEAYQAMKLILTGGCTDFQIGAFLAAMRIKSETAEELTGFIRAVSELAPPIQPQVDSLFDFGDPYDGKTKTVNLSLLTALILSCAACPVILHGDNHIPAKQGIGVGEILGALGASLDLDSESIQRSLEELSLGYIHISHFIPRFETLKPLRLQYGLRSSFNVIEKMWNLCGAQFLAVGIYHAPYFESSAQAFLKMKITKGFVVQGVEGFGELRINRPTKYLEVCQGKVAEKFVIPQDHGFSHAKNWDLEEGLDPRVHAEITRKILKGEKGLVYKGAVFNAGVKLFWSEKVSSIEEGIRKAQAILDSGQALNKLEAFIKFTSGRSHARLERVP